MMSSDRSISQLRLQEIVSMYSYGKLDLLDRIDEVNFRFENGVLVADNWYDFSTENKHGDCEELTTKASLLLREEFPSLDHKIFWGYEPTFFLPEVGQHSFILINGRTVFDPSLGRLSHYDGSGYLIKDQEPEEELERRIRGEKIAEFDGGLPIGIDSKTKFLFYIGYNTGRTSTGPYRTVGGNDFLVLTSYRILDLEGATEKDLEMGSLLGISRVDKRNWQITDIPSEIVEQVPCLQLAQALEKKAASDLSK